MGTKPATSTTTEVEIPADMKGKTVKQVLDDWEKRLEQQAREFLTEAKQIARWDRSIYECLSLMQHLEQQIKTVEGRQKELAQTAQQLLKDQEDLIRQLVDKKKDAHVAQMGGQRQRLYRLAHDLGERFLEMEAELKRLVEQTEEQAEGRSQSDVGKIVKIANYHLDSMKWLEAQCQTIEERVAQIGKRINST